MKISVHGLGLFCSLGKTPDEVYRRMCAGEHAFRPIWRFPVDSCQQKMAGQISPADEEYLRDRFPELDLAGAMAMEAALQALQQAGLSTDGDARTALVMASNFGPLEAQEWLWREKLDTGEVSLESNELVDDFLPSIAQALGCLGPRVQLSMSCASGLAALAVASDMLLSRRADRVVALAYDLLSEFSWHGLYNLRTITNDTMRPFDRRRSGTIFSEGAAAVLLSNAELAANNKPPLAILASAATNNNAFHITAPLPEAEGSRLVMREALRLAKLKPEDIDHVCAHATSTVANDKTEAGALRNLFGERLAQITVAAHKSQLGHLLGAAGLAEMVVTVLAMQNSVLPPTLNHQQMDPDCKPIDCIPTKARTSKIKTAIINSAGIGGNNSAAVLMK
jgi:3-oxoacyl-[acyl-carrier-protein] synthase II